MNGSNDAIVNKRGMVTIPKAIRDKFGLKEGSRIFFMAIDGTLEIIPYRTIEEIESACTVTKEEMGRVFDEDHQTELRLENEKQ
ncbi:MAG: AbrB/MazE/SpoVT family DNA-binding domain-containing protein [Candidatus Lokiarchaeota archaeon]|nr:AbrB/MazE/SpoVT family DNA-binding domain-containing protein [Candidatus Lokiarchaeota archaeon]